MTARDFCYWCQGFFELRDSNEPLTAEQTETIQRHLAMVFVHEIDPSFPADEQQPLTDIHDGTWTFKVDPNAPEQPEKPQYQLWHGVIPQPGVNALGMTPRC